MAERKAVNRYYPSDLDPKKHGSINKYRKSHPLRERARKLHLGILVIRFEMPYNIWCEGCGNHIGTGVRYNAEKSKIGMYYSTPVYKFRMKCHLCDNHFEIKTDPQNMDYEIISGASRQERRWDPSENDQIAPEDKDVSKKLATDAMFKLEHATEDKTKESKAKPILAKLEHLQDRWKDDYTANQLLRKGFREKKKELISQAEKDRSLLARSSLDIKLLPESNEDDRAAKLLSLMPAHTFNEKQKMKRAEIADRPLFCAASPATLKTKIVSAVQHEKMSRMKPLQAEKLGITRTPRKCGEDKELDASETEKSTRANVTSGAVSLVSADYSDSSSVEDL
ncbi:coiled-coil domain-containing protein 130 homolog [Ornithodoros turicata]|uniref:coiled-coil domain-containing protein 130 homolog n=1 Tax=Ornithodoros turicata TaxID=34597 RepID=UPI003139D7D9